MILTLREKRRQKIRLAFRIGILAIDIAGLFLCLYLETILMKISKNPDVEILFENLLRQNAFILQEFNAAISAAKFILFILVAGLCVMLYQLINHEVQSRAHIHRLMHCIGYRTLQIYIHEFVYEVWDLLWGFVISGGIFIVLRIWITKNGKVMDVFKMLHWSVQGDLFVFFGVMVLVCLLNGGVCRKIYLDFM